MFNIFDQVLLIVPAQQVYVHLLWFPYQSQSELVSKLNQLYCQAMDSIILSAIGVYDRKSDSRVVI